MPPLPAPLRSRLPGRDRTRGAVAVEAAIVLPVVVLLFMGILEFGLIFKDSLAMASGVRAGGRIASAEPLKLSFAGDAATQVGEAMKSVGLKDVATLYVFDPDTTTDPRTACTTRCVTFDWDVAAASFIAKSSAWDQCARDSTRVGLVLVVKHRGLSGASYASPTLTEKAVFAFEPASTTATCQ